MCLEKWSQYHSKLADSHLLWFTENCSSKYSIKLSEFRVLHTTFIVNTMIKDISVNKLKTGGAPQIGSAT